MYGLAVMLSVTMSATTKNIDKILTLIQIMYTNTI